MKVHDINEGIYIIEYPEDENLVYYKGQIAEVNCRKIRQGSGMLIMKGKNFVVNELNISDKQDIIIYDGEWKDDLPHGHGVLRAFGDTFKVKKL